MTQAMAADYSLAPDTLAVAIKSALTANQPLMIWGSPGIGKSAVAEQVAAEMGMRYVDVRTLLLDPVDLRGIPWRDDNDRTRWAPPIFLPPEDTTEGYVLNLEELPAAVPMVQAALYQLVFHPRKLGEYTLPDSARIIACGNREEDRAVSRRMSTALASRFVHVDARVDCDAWIEWALGANIATEVIFFLKYRPELLQQFDPKSKELAFPCPRTWALVAGQIDAGGLKACSEVDLALLRGTVGEGAAVEFAAFMETYKQLPLPESVFTDPLGVAVPESPDALMMLCAALCRRAEEDKMDALVDFATRTQVRPEIGEFLMNTSMKIHPDSRYTKAFVRWGSHISKL